MSKDHSGNERNVFLLSLPNHIRTYMLTTYCYMLHLLHKLLLEYYETNKHLIHLL